MAEDESITKEISHEWIAVHLPIHPNCRCVVDGTTVLTADDACDECLEFADEINNQDFE